MASRKAPTKKRTSKKLINIQKGIDKVKKKKTKATRKSKPVAAPVAAIAVSEGRAVDKMVDDVVFSPLTHRREAVLIAQACEVFHFEIPPEKKKTKSNPKGAGRPAEIDDRTLSKLEYAFAFDSTVEEACILAGINPVTYYRFIKKYPEFSNTVAILRHIPMTLIRQVLVTGAMSNFDNALKYAAVKNKQEFSPKIELNANMTETVEVSPEAKEAVDKVFALFERKALASKVDYVVVESDV